MHPGASDRPWIDVYPRKNTTPTASNPDKDTVYLEYPTFSPDDFVYVTVSNDGGKTFSLPHIIESDTSASRPVATARWPLCITRRPLGRERRSLPLRRTEAMT